jgi:hypothetical protein
MCKGHCRKSYEERGKVTMKVNIKETLDILNNSKVTAVKHVKPKNLTFEVYKLTSFRNALKQ